MNDAARPDLPAEAEVIVVGGGTAGAAVAARLVEGGREVLVLEAGPDPGPLGSPEWPQDLVDATRLGTLVRLGLRLGRYLPGPGGEVRALAGDRRLLHPQRRGPDLGPPARLRQLGRVRGTGLDDRRAAPLFRARHRAAPGPHLRARRADPLAGGLARRLDRYRRAAAGRPERARRDGRRRPRVGQHRRRGPLQRGLLLPRPAARRRAADDRRRRAGRPA